MTLPIIIVAVLLVIAIVIYRGKIAKRKEEKEKAEEIPDLMIDYSIVETEIIDYINQYREDLGLGRLQFNNYISHICEGHIDYCLVRKKVSHDNFPMRSSKIMNKLKAKAVGEVVAKGYSGSQSVVDAWRRSDGHNTQLTTEKYNRVGICLKMKEGKMYVIVMFAKV